MPQWNKTTVEIIRKLAFYLILIIVWELSYHFCVEVLCIWKPYSFASPIAVLRTLTGLITDNSLSIAILASIKRIAQGYGISLLVGLLVGLIIVKFKYIGENIRPLILGFQTLPSIGWLPFAILWYGLNESSIIFITAIGSTFSVIIAVESGMKNVNPLYIKAARTMGAKGIRMYTDVIIPAALPVIASGLKQGWSFAWRALIAGEMLCATVGLGHILMMGREVADISQVMAVMSVIILLGLAVDKLIFAQIESKIMHRWGLEQGPL